MQKYQGLSAFITSARNPVKYSAIPLTELIFPAMLNPFK